MHTFYVSSFGKNSNKGIYIVHFDENSDELSIVQHIVTKDYPSYMVIKDNNLYITYKNANRSSDGGGLGRFAIYKDELIINNNFASNGRSYTHLCISDNSRYLFAANYQVGSTASYLLENGHIKEKIGAIHHIGLGPDLLKRQTGPHCHYVGISPDKEFVYAVDLGADKVIMYKYYDGKLEEDSNHNLNVVPGQVLHTTPRHFHGFSSASAIRLSKSGKHLFVSNRGHDSIALYRVNQETGKITLLYMVHTGKTPRDFNFISSKYLIVGAQDDDEIELFKFNEEKEELIRTAITLAIPSPVCIAVKDKREK